jgi:inactivated superfamily I helicase
MNEGKFPAGKSQNSFLSLMMLRELGLPTFKEKMRFINYHFLPCCNVPKYLSALQ